MVALFDRAYRGLVDGRAGQCGSTRFLTVAFMPAVPLGGTWLFNPVTGAGHDMKMSAKSVAAAYARAWGPVVAAFGAIVGGTGTVVAAAALAMTGWTWSWRYIFDGRRKRRLAMNQLALGTGCEPARMTPEYAAEVRASVDDNWRQYGTGGSPGDVARFGSDDPRCAAAAYGVLRMSAFGLPADQRAELEGDANRILDNLRELPSGEPEHPYRAGGAHIRRALPAQGRRASSTPRTTPMPAAAQPIASESPVVPVQTARLSQLLRDELRAHRFTTIELDATILDVEVDQVLVRRRFGSHIAVVHLRAPRSQLAIHASVWAKDAVDSDLVALSRELLPSLGTRIGYGPWRPLSVHLVWSGGSIVERAREIRRALVASEPSLNLHSISIADLTAKHTSVSRTKMRRSTHRVVDVIARCVDQAIG